MSASNYSTSVPAPSLTDAGFVAPSEQDILTGVLSDINAALGGNANTSLATPQGQLAVSQTAILGDAYAAILAVFNGMDPAANSGRMQEAIGQIYFLTRRPATATTVSVQITSSGGGQTILAGTSVAVDDEGNLYAPISDVTLPTTAGQSTMALACQTLGAITCPIGGLSLYQSGLGITALTNEEVGVTGSAVETSAAFETRRIKSVAANSIGQNASILGALLALDDVTDAYVVDNPTATTATINQVAIAPYSLYIVVQGGTDAEIASTIINHKSPGCAMQGTTSVQITDSNTAYNGNNPTYTVNFNRVEEVPFYIVATLAQSNTLVPQNAATLAASALMAYLQADATRPRMGSTIYASRLATTINALGDWADVLELSIGLTSSAGESSLNLPINQLLTPDSSKITVTIAQS